MSVRGGRFIRDFDFVLLAVALALLGYGAALIYSGSLTTYGRSGWAAFSHPVGRQLAYAAVGILVFAVLARMDYRSLGNVAVGLYVAGIAALVFVLVVGGSAYGSRRWITLGGAQIQASEVAKVLVIVALARYLADHQEEIQRPRIFLTSLLMALVPAGLVFAEPDLGSAVIFLAVWLGMVVIAGARPAHLALLFGSAISAIPFVLVGLVNDYQRERIRLWLDPGNDPLGSGFNILQAQISIGSGRLWGKGFTHGTQTQLDYLRTQTTDYIFSVLGEELGFMGAMLLFALFVILLFRGIRVAGVASDLFGRLVAVGVVIFILSQVFINIGVNVRVFPVTGIPLPLISQGGSSLVSVFAALGILESILLHRRRLWFYGGSLERP